LRLAEKGKKIRKSRKKTTDVTVDEAKNETDNNTII